MKTLQEHIITVLVTVAMTLFAFAMLPAHAQTRKVMNRPYIDQRKFHYGFLAGANLQDLELQQNGYVDEAGNQWYAETPGYEPGFSVGILGEFYLAKHLAFRIIPSMHFGTKNVQFRNELNGDKQFQTIKSTYFAVPLNIKYAAERFNNYRPYIVTGITPVLDLTVKKQKQLLLKSADCYLELGLGCDLYLPFFKFIPEVKFMYGLSNIINKDRSDMTDDTQLIFTQSVDKGKSKMIVLTFYFE